MRQFCEEQEIKQTTPYTTSHAPHVERVQATLQNLIYKHITSRMNFRYIDSLDKLVSTYNNRVHRSTGLSPNQGKGLENVWKNRCVWVLEEVPYALSGPQVGPMNSPGVRFLFRQAETLFPKTSSLINKKFVCCCCRGKEVGGRKQKLQ